MRYLFESCVILYGSKTLKYNQPPIGVFESSVISYGSKTKPDLVYQRDYV